MRIRVEWLAPLRFGAFCVTLAAGCGRFGFDAGARENSGIDAAVDLGGANVGAPDASSRDSAIADDAAPPDTDGSFDANLSDGSALVDMAASDMGTVATARRFSDLSGCLGRTMPRPPRACDPEGRPFGGGSGVRADPYTICAEEHLRGLVDAPSASFELSRSLEISANWTPIPMFSGRLDGNGFTLSNLHIDASDTDRLAFIDTLSGAMDHVAFEDVTISGRSQVATIAVNTVGTATISNVIVRTSVTAEDGYACGVACGMSDESVVRSVLVEGLIRNFASGSAGWTGGVATSVAPSSVISDVDMRATVSAPDAWKTGGITVDLAGLVRRVEVSGQIHGGNRTGGVASVLVAGGRLEDVLVSGTVRSTTSVAGGLFAETWSATTPAVTRAVVTGPVIVGDGGSSLGVCAMNCGPASYGDVYYVDETTMLTGCGSGVSCTELTVSEARDPTTFESFPAFWTFESGALPSLCAPDSP